MSTTDKMGVLLRAARLEAGLSLAALADITHYSKPYLGLVEPGARTATVDVVAAYEQALGVNMSRKDITHPGLRPVKGNRAIKALRMSVDSGEPDVLALHPTGRVSEAAVGSRLGPDGVGHLRRWMIEGASSTLRANALGVVATLPGRANAELVVQVLEEDEKVRRLCLASDISRLTQLDWPTALRLADDLPSVPKPKRLAAKAAKEALDPKDTESRWCGAYMLRKLAPVLGR